MQECPECKRKSLRYRSSFNSYICNRCHALFDNKMKYRGRDEDNKISFDDYSNMYRTDTTNSGVTIVQTITYLLEEGKVTLRGEHQKLKSDCPHPERLDCNYGIGYPRCPMMKYTGDRWICEKA